jgi:hypothetical protein
MREIAVAAFASSIDKAMLFQFRNQLSDLPWHSLRLSES